SLIVTAPFDELIDGYHLQVMLIRKTTQLFRTSHRGRVFFRDDFTQNTRWTQARQASQVDGGFRVPITLKNTIRTCSQRNHMPWTGRSEEHTSELQSRFELVCRILREQKLSSRF